MKKLTKSIVVVITILFLLTPKTYGFNILEILHLKKPDSEKTIKEHIKDEDGSLFEKIIAETIGSIAQTVINFTTGEDSNVGFEDYESLLFNTGKYYVTLRPFNDYTWSETMYWYKIFAGLSGSLIFLAVIILGYKVIYAGMNIAKKNEAKESLMRLLFGGVVIALAPMFIRLVLTINNTFVMTLTKVAEKTSLNKALGNDMLTSIKTGSAISTALVISMFIYLFVKINIKFIIREFTIIIFTIFTPIAAGLWIINKNVTAASIWAGQLITNIFMQFVYCFLFIIYLAFVPSSSEWAVSLIWAMMILPMGDALQNCFQNLTSRIAGIDNEQMTGRVLGTSAMLGFSLGAIKEQFNVPKSPNNTNGDGGGLKGLISRAKSVVTPGMNLSPEKDYDGNVNPIRNVIPNTKTTNSNSINTNTLNINKDISMSNSMNNQENPAYKGEKNTLSTIGKVAKTGFKATKTYLEAGASLAEGDFSRYKNRPSQNRNNKKMNQVNPENTEYINTMAKVNLEKKLGESHEQEKEK